MLANNKLHNKNPYYIENEILKDILMTISKDLRSLYFLKP